MLSKFRKRLQEKVCFLICFYLLIEYGKCVRLRSNHRVHKLNPPYSPEVFVPFLIWRDGCFLYYKTGEEKITQVKLINHPIVQYGIVSCDFHGEGGGLMACFWVIMMKLINLWSFVLFFFKALFIYAWKRHDSSKE